MSYLPGRLYRSAAIPLAFLLTLALPACVGAVVSANPTPPQNLKASVLSHVGTVAAVRIAWTAPANDGDGTGPVKIGGYTVTVAPAVSGGGCTVGGTTLSCDVNGFTLGASYKISIQTWNTVEARSEVVSITYKVPVLPGAPTGFTATIVTNENSRATVKLAWNAPSSDGGGAITGYSVSGGSGIGCSVPGSMRTCQIVGLWTNRTFTFTIVATNVIGSGPAAQVSLSIPASPAGPASAAPSDSAVPTASTSTASASPEPSATPAPTDTPSPSSAVSGSPPASASASPSASIPAVAPAESTGGSGPDLLILLLIGAAMIAAGVGGGIFLIRHTPSPSH